MNENIDNTVNPFQAPADAEANAPSPGEPALPITLTGDLTVDDYLAAWRLAKWKTADLWIRYTGRAALVVLGTAFLLRAWRSSQLADWNSVAMESAFGIAMLGCLAWMMLAIRRNVRRHIASTDAKLGDAPLIVDEQGVHVAGPAMSIDCKWEGFAGYRTNGPVLVLYADYPRQYVGVFEKHAASPTHWNFLKEFVGEKLSEL
jgi:hypothetical protein